MRRLFLVVLLALAACGKPSGSTTPSNQYDREPLTKDSLVAFVATRFPAEVKAGTLKLDFGSGVEKEVLEELHLMGIDTVGQFAAIVPADYEQRGLPTAPTTNVAGMTRDLMIIHDTRGYFQKAWRDSWSASPEDFPAPEAYGVDMQVLRELGVFDEHGDGDEGMEDGGDPCGDWGGDPCGD